MDCIIVGDACDGAEGLKLIEEHKPDLVITDIKMPLMDGIEMLKKALQTYKFYSIILTSYSEFEYAKQAISLKVYEYLLKPVDEEKLRAVIEKVKYELSQEKLLGTILEKTKSGNELELINLDIYLFSESNINFYVDETIKQIKQNYDKKISIESISNNLGVSPSYLSRKIREVTSQTFLDILHQYRVQKAVELLKSGKLRIYGVLNMTGCGD